MGANQWKTIILIIITVMAILIIGYSTFAQPIAQITTSNSSDTWKVGFVDAKISEVSGNAGEVAPVSYTSSYATFNISINGSGDAITYEFTIKNSGTLDARVESIYIVPANQDGDAILFETSQLNEGDELAVGQTATIKVKAYYNPSYTGSSAGLSKSAQIIINYVQNS